MADHKAGVGRVLSSQTAAVKHITDIALQVLEKNPEGLRYTDLAEQVAAKLPQYSFTYIGNVVPRLSELAAGRVVRPSRGLYCLRVPSNGGGLAPARIGTLEHSGPRQPRQRAGSVNRIRTAAVELLKTNPGGLRNRELARQLAKRVADASNVAILRVITDLPKYYPTEVERPATGLYRYRATPASTNEALPIAEARKKRISENDFYASFADWLKHETEECSVALPLGGCKFGGKWGTPDVIGILKKKSTDPVDFPTEIVSAEIKLDDAQLIIAFGQACAYRLFSHKSYLVVPKSSQKADVDKLDSLCMVLGVGLVLFDSSNPEKPNFEIRVRPLMHAPDMYYANLYLKQVEGLW